MDRGYPGYIPYIGISPEKFEQHTDDNEAPDLDMAAEISEQPTDVAEDLGGFAIEHFDIPKVDPDEGSDSRGLH